MMKVAGSIAYAAIATLLPVAVAGALLDIPAMVAGPVGPIGWALIAVIITAITTVVMFLYSTGDEPIVHAAAFGYAGVCLGITGVCLFLGAIPVVLYLFFATISGNLGFDTFNPLIVTCGFVLAGIVTSFLTLTIDA